jgi:hypothetical protein
MIRSEMLERMSAREFYEWAVFLSEHHPPATRSAPMDSTTSFTREDTFRAFMLAHNARIQSKKPN